MSHKRILLGVAALMLAGWFMLPAEAKTKAGVFVYASGDSVTGGNDLLTVDYTPSMSGSFIRLTIMLPTSTVLNVTMDDGTTVNVAGLNVSSALNADDLYSFDIPCSPGVSYNFQPETTQAGVDLLIVQEVAP